MNKDAIIKQLISQAKKYGYLTFDDINKTFSEKQLSKEEIVNFIDALMEIGVRIVEVERQKPIIKEKIDISEDIIQEEPLRVFLDEVSRIESIDRKTELAIAKNIRVNERKLLSVVLSSPIALRELNNWMTLLQQNEMTPKELMRRGRKSKRSLKKMKQKLSATIKKINRLDKEICQYKKLVKKHPSNTKKRKLYQDKVAILKQKIVNHILQLELNTEKVKRLVKRAENITEKFVQLINEVEKYEQLFSCSYDKVTKLFSQVKNKKISPKEFRRITGYSVSAAEVMLDNFSRVVAKVEQYQKEFNVSSDEIIEIHNKIKELVRYIEEDKMKLIKANLSLVVTFARKFAALTGVDVDDLIQEGATGLSKAVEKFEWRKGYKFSTYAHWWVRQAISRYMADYVKTIRMPVHIRELVSKMIKVYKNFKHKYSREIRLDDYCRALKVQPKKIIDMLSVLAEPLSFHTPIGKDEEATLQDFIHGTEKEVPFYAIMESYKRHVLDEAMQVLDEREREILKLRYGFIDGKEYTLEEVGRMFNITRERVRQIEAKAIRKLREPEILEKLKEAYPIRK